MESSRPTTTCARAPGSEPVGTWGKGAVRLIELHAPDETADNITAFWVPEALPAPGEPIELTYKLHWYMDQIHPPAGFVSVSTRQGRTATQETELERFVVDFDGAYLSKEGPDPQIEAVVTVGAGAKFVNSTIQKNPFNGSWRVAFAIRPDGTGHPVEYALFPCASRPTSSRRRGVTCGSREPSFPRTTGRLR